VELRHKDAVNSSRFSSDGKKVVTGSDDRTARLWDARSGAELQVFEHQQPVTNAKFNPRGDKLVTASQDGTARVWDVDTAETLAVLTGHNDAVIDATFDDIGQRIVTASNDRTVRLWDGRLDNSSAILSGHNDQIVALAVSRDNQRIATASNDGITRIWDEATTKAPLVLKGHSGGINTITFSSNGERVLTGSDDNTARVWDAHTGLTVSILKGHDSAVRSADFSLDGKRAVTASKNIMRLWDAATGKLLLKRDEHTQDLNVVSFSPRGSLLVSASDDGTVRFWDGETGELVGDLEDKTAAENSIVEPAMRLDAMGPVEPTTESASIPTNGAKKGEGRQGKRNKAHEGSVVAAIFSSDGSRILTKSSTGQARLWNVENRAAIATLDRVSDIAFSGDGERIVTSSSDNIVRILDGHTARFLSEFQAVRGPTVLSFSPNGKLVLTASGRIAQLWDAENGIMLATFEGHKREITSAAFFSTDGQRIVTTSSDNAARLWDIPSLQTKDLITYASISALRQLSPEEHQKIFGEEKSPIVGNDEAERCDQLAGLPTDPNNKRAVGIYFPNIRPEEAILACDAALVAQPEEPRFLFQLGRALEKAARFPEAFDKYERAAGHGYVAAYTRMRDPFANSISIMPGALTLAGDGSAVTCTAAKAGACCAGRHSCRRHPYSWLG
jgi:WD40 repeat protein